MNEVLKSYIEELLTCIADELNIKQVILNHQYSSSIFSFDTIKGESIGLDGEWPLYSLVFTGEIKQDMKKVREYVRIGLKKRAISKIKLKQPLQSLTISL